MNSVMHNWQVRFQIFFCYMMLTSCMSMADRDFGAEWLLGGNVYNVSWCVTVS